MIFICRICIHGYMYIMFVNVQGAGLAGIVMACEIFPAAQRTFAGTAIELFWAASWMVLALIAYFIRNWRYLQLTISLPPVITLVLIWSVAIVLNKFTNYKNMNYDLAHL